jgi:hypothetical protein
MLPSVVVLGGKCVDHAAPGARPSILHLKVEAPVSQGHFDVVVPVLHGKSLASQKPQRQSAKLFLQSSELGLSHPLTRRRVSPPPPNPCSGERGTLAGEGLGESHFRRGDMHCGTLYICVLCGLNQISCHRFLYKRKNIARFRAISVRIVVWNTTIIIYFAIYIRS